jgi:pimeloyl-ACP methyl ester carboxylesterase
MMPQLSTARLECWERPRGGEALSPPVLPAQPWSDMALTWLGMALDRVALRGMRLAFDALLHPSPAEIDAARESAAPYVTNALLSDPRRFFDFLDEAPEPVPMHEGRPRERHRGVVVTRQFLTRYVPYHCSGTWPRCVENDRVTVEHWMHRPGPPRATVLALHGFTMGTPSVDAHVLMAATWFELGFDVALLALPFHGPRSPRSARYSGELFASWDVSRMNEAVRQAVQDIHVVKTWIERTTDAPVGLLGVSLGGYLAALMAGLCANLAFVVPVVPPVFLHALVCSLLALDRAAAPPMPLEKLREGYSVHCPLTYPLAVPRERVLVVGARGDCLVPPEHAHALWQHWGTPAVHWYSGSHTAPFRRARLLTTIRRHFEALDLLGEPSP